MPALYNTSRLGKEARLSVLEGRCPWCNLQLLPSLDPDTGITNLECIDCRDSFTIEDYE